MDYPILKHKYFEQDTVFTPENLLREARRQKSLDKVNVPDICILDPDGDIVHNLLEEDKTKLQTQWACYHTKLYTFSLNDIEFGIIGHVVGSSFAVLVAEELFASGCKLIISFTSAGQILPIKKPPYFILIDKAIRDEGTSYHYLPPAKYSNINNYILETLKTAFNQSSVSVEQGATWTTDAPFRETNEAIKYYKEDGVLAVEMEAAALYALAEAKGKHIICFAHVTNQMGNREGDFEKGELWGNSYVFKIIVLIANKCNTLTE